MLCPFGDDKCPPRLVSTFVYFFFVSAFDGLFYGAWLNERVAEAAGLLYIQKGFEENSSKPFLADVVTWEGLEPPTLWFVAKYSDPTELPGQVAAQATNA